MLKTYKNVEMLLLNITHIASFSDRECKVGETKVRVHCYFKYGTERVKNYKNRFYSSLVVHVSFIKNINLRRSNFINYNFHTLYHTKSKIYVQPDIVINQ